MSYYLDKDSHYDELKDNMDKLKLKFNPKIIDEFDKIEQNDNILDAFTGAFDNTVTKLNDFEKEQKETEKDNNDNKINKSTGILYNCQQILNAFTDIFIDKDAKFDTIIKEIEHDLSKHKTYNDNRAFVARYTLGYQLEYCLRTTDGDCYIHCEC